MGTTQAERDQPTSAEQERGERERVNLDELVDFECDQSFPASDPPSRTQGPD